MIYIKQQGFQLALPKILPKLIVMRGHDTYLLSHFKQLIKALWIKFCPRAIFEQLPAELLSTQKWCDIATSLYNYSLFSDNKMLYMEYTNKTINDDGKNFIINYLNNHDQSTIIILYAPNLVNKAWQFVVNNLNIAFLLFKVPPTKVIEQWIIQKLKLQDYKFNADVPKLIYHYTQGNLLACAQLIEKLIINYDTGTNISFEILTPYLNDQAVYQLYELSDACLLGDTVTALIILRNIINNNYDLTLILWSITQELRNLLQINYLMQHNNLNFNDACAQLKLWISKLYLYQSALQRIESNLLKLLLSWCVVLDGYIKNNIQDCVHRLEILILSICRGCIINNTL